MVTFHLTISTHFDLKKITFFFIKAIFYLFPSLSVSSTKILSIIVYTLFLATFLFFFYIFIVLKYTKDTHLFL